MRDGEPEIEEAPEVTEATVDGKKVEIKDNAVEIEYEEDTKTIPELTIKFDKKVKVSEIVHTDGTKYNTEGQLKYAAEWIGYNVEELEVLTDTITLTGTTRTFAEVIDKLGDSFTVTVVNKDGESLSITINLDKIIIAKLSEIVDRYDFTLLPGSVQIILNPAKLEEVFGADYAKNEYSLELDGELEKDNFTLDEGNWSLTITAPDGDNNEAKETLGNGIVRIVK